MRSRGQIQSFEARQRTAAEVHLGALHRILEEHRADLQEVCVNGSVKDAGDVWLYWDRVPERPKGELFGNWERRMVPGLDRGWAGRLCETLAVQTGRTFSESMPLLGCGIPGHRDRLQALVGPNVEQGFAVAIRVQRKILRPLEDWEVGIGSSAAVANRGRHPALPPESAELTEDEAIATCIRLMKARASILVTGATGASKTSFINALLQHLPQDLRVVTVQDTEELFVANPNWVSLIVARGISANRIGYAEVIDSILRFLPQVAICGELSVDNVRGATRIMNTGHGGFMITAHANSALDGFHAWQLNYELAAAETGGGGRADAVLELLKRGLDVVIHIERHGHRRVASVFSPADFSFGGRV
jgi:type IV secretion system protein VirB11